MDFDEIKNKDDSTELPDEERELFEHFRILVDRGQTPLRIDKFLSDKIGNKVSRNRIQNAAKAECILVNGNAVKPNYKIKPSDEIVILLPQAPVDLEILPEDIPINIVYEDDYLAVVNKSAGMVVHPGYNNFNHTLVNALLFHFSKENTNAQFPLLVHRIDKDTSGLLIVAKDEYTQTHLARQFYEHSTERLYRALVWGDVEPDSGIISGYISRSTRDRRMMAVYDNEDDGKWSVTHFNIVERFGFCTFIECKLETGRTHQIRAHMKHIGHPLFADEMYGGKIIVKGNPTTKFKQFIDNCFEIMPRQALHAATLGFLHPVTNKQMLFESSLPDDFEKLLSKIRKMHQS